MSAVNCRSFHVHIVKKCLKGKIELKHILKIVIHMLVHLNDFSLHPQCITQFPIKFKRWLMFVFVFYKVDICFKCFFYICIIWIRVIKYDVLGYFPFEDERYYCKNCCKSYKHKRHLSSHLRYECGKKPSFECRVCKRRFYQRYTLNAHLRQIHFVETWCIF